MRSRFYIARGLKKDYERIQKHEGEIFYLTDTGELANHKKPYKSIIDGGYFADYENKTRFEGIDGGEF